MIILLLTLIHIVFPDITRPELATRSRKGSDATVSSLEKSLVTSTNTRGTVSNRTSSTSSTRAITSRLGGSRLSMAPSATSSNDFSVFFSGGNGRIGRHVFSIPRFKGAFPSRRSMRVMTTDGRNITPIRGHRRTRRDGNGLICINDGPFFCISGLGGDVPCLIPETSMLLRSVNQTCFSSLRVGNVPLRGVVIADVLHAGSSISGLEAQGNGTARGSYRLCNAAFSIYCGQCGRVRARGRPHHRIRGSALG